MKINAINISREGIPGDPVVMELSHFLKASKIQPGRWKPADENSASMIKKIPLDAVPVGTTPDDVAKFETNKGKSKGKKESRFELMLKAAESGADISDIEDDAEIPTAPEDPLLNAPTDHKSVNADPTPGEIFSDPAVNLKKEAKYKKDDLMALTMDKIQAIAAQETSGLDEKMKNQILKIKKKEDLVDNIIQLTKV